MNIGVILFGDYALATSKDEHLAAVRALNDAAIQFVWMIPADPVQTAAALYAALERPHPVVCFGGLGDAADDYVRASVHALVAGRQDVGLAAHAYTSDRSSVSLANVYCLQGAPSAAHAALKAWWSSADRVNAEEVTEMLPWRLPESASARTARAKLREDYPHILQRVVGSERGLRLVLTGSSKGKVQAARKALQKWMDSL